MASATVERLVSANPATGEELGSVEVWSAERVGKAVEEANRAFRGWSRLPVKERAQYIRRAKELLVKRSAETAELITRENGKPRIEALLHDVLTSIDAMDYYGEYGPGFLARERIPLRVWSLLGRRSYVDYAPLGVIGVISPWNYPLSLALIPTVMALLAGNTVVLKPAEATPLSARVVEEIFRDAGLPEGVLHVAYGAGPTGQALCERKELRTVIFTGSTATGRQVMMTCARNLTPVLLELGGKDPMLVLKDAPLETAIRGAAWGSFFNAGQTCCSIERIYVHRSRYDDFLAGLVEQARSIRVGNGLDRDVDMGPLTLERQRDKVEHQVEDARRRGARILTGGERVAGPGFFYRPTVIADVDHSFEVVREESFGPVVSVMPFDDEYEALELANDSPYGLTASIWTQDVARAEALAQSLITGNVVINDHGVTYGMPETPWGGAKESGVGRLHGRIGLQTLTGPRHLHVNPWASMKQQWWYPYSAKAFDVAKGLSGVFGGDGMSGKAKGLMSAVFQAYRALAEE